MFKDEPDEIERLKALALLQRWNQAFDRWCAGSEFYNEPEAIAKRIGEMIGSRVEDRKRIKELEADRDLLDGAADIRIVDGIGDIDIDEATLNAIMARGADRDSEETWKLEWRKQLRIALKTAIDAEKGQGKLSDADIRLRLNPDGTPMNS